MLTEYLIFFHFVFLCNHVWAYDFVMDRTHNGKRFRMLTIIDKYTRECLAITVDRNLNSTDVVDTLLDLFVMHGVPNGTSLSISSNIFATVRDYFYFMSWCGHKLIIFLPSFKTSWFASPWTLYDRCTGHRFI